MDPTRSSSSHLGHGSYPPNFNPAQHIQGDIAANFCPSGSVQQRGPYLPPSQLAPYMNPRSMQPVDHPPGQYYYPDDFGMEHPMGYRYSSGYSYMEPPRPAAMQQQLQQHLQQQQQQQSLQQRFDWHGSRANYPGNYSGVSNTPSQHASPRTKRKRTSFTTEQMLVMEKHFEKNRYISRPERVRMAQELGLPEKQIKIWFQNQRMKKGKKPTRCMNQTTEEESKDDEVGKTRGRCSANESSLDVQQQATEVRGEADTIEEQSLVNKDQTMSVNRPIIVFANELGEPDVLQSTISHEDASTAPSQPPGNDLNDEDLDNASTVAMSPIRNLSDGESSDEESDEECKSALKTNHQPDRVGVVLTPSRLSGRSLNEPIRSVGLHQLGSINNRITTNAGPSKFGPSNEHDDDDDDEESSESDSDLEQESIVKQFQMTFGQSGSGRAAMFGQSGNAAMFKQSGNAPGFGQTRFEQSQNAAMFGQSGIYARFGQSGNATRFRQSGNYARFGQSGNAARFGQDGSAARFGQSGSAARFDHSLPTSSDLNHNDPTLDPGRRSSGNGPFWQQGQNGSATGRIVSTNHNPRFQCNSGPSTYSLGHSGPYPPQQQQQGQQQQQRQQQQQQNQQQQQQNQQQQQRGIQQSILHQTSCNYNNTHSAAYINQQQQQQQRQHMMKQTDQHQQLNFSGRQPPMPQNSREYPRYMYNDPGRNEPWPGQYMN